MSNAKLSLAAVFGALGATADAATNTVNTVASIVDIGAAYVREAALNQRIEQALDRDEFIAKLVEDRAIARVKRAAEIESMCSDPVVREKFEAARTYYTEIANRCTATPV